METSAELISAIALAQDVPGQHGELVGEKQALLARAGWSHEKEESSFLKKRRKRLLLLGVSAGLATYAKSQKFFGSFFKKEQSSCLVTWQ